METVFYCSKIAFQNQIQVNVANTLVVDGSVLSLDDKLNTACYRGVQVGKVVGAEAAPNCKSNYGKEHFVLIVSALLLA